MTEKPLSERIHEWEFELKTDQDWTTLDKVQGIREEVKVFESRNEWLQRRLKTECDEGDQLKNWLGAIATLIKEDAGETPEIIYEAVDEKIKGIFADWYVETQDRDMYEHELNEKLKSAESRLSKAHEAMTTYLCESFMNFPDDVTCGSKRHCKRYFFCEAMKDALAVGNEEGGQEK